MMSNVVGLTGGIATGKSLVSSFLKQRGVVVIDADQVTREVQAKGTPGLTAIVQEFGPAILTPDGYLDRHALGELVFSDQYQLKQLVKVIDPFIRYRVTELLRDNVAADLVVLDAPTLLESGYQNMVDEIVVVSCSAELQLKRLISRNQLSIAQATNRIKAQWPLAVKRQLADFVISNSGTKKQTQQQVTKWLTERTQAAEGAK